MGASLKNKRDAEAFGVMRQLPALNFYSFVRQNKDIADEQRREFFLTGRPPVFTYPGVKTFDLETYLSHIERAIGSLSKERDALVAELYDRKYTELKIRASLLLAVRNGDDQTVTHLSKKLFGPMRQSADDLRLEFGRLLRNASQLHQHSKPVTAQFFRMMVKETLLHYGMFGRRIKMYGGSSVKISRGKTARTPSVYVPKNLRISRARARRLLTHEIEVHALRTHNGTQAPIYLLSMGLDQYLPTDEGLAIYFQQQLSKDDRQFPPGFWDAWTCALTQVGTFTDTFKTISTARAELAQATGQEDPESLGRDAAWRLCLRAYRGITNPDQYGVGFLRDHMYRSGWMDVMDAIDEKGEDIVPKLFVGKVGLHHLDMLPNRWLLAPQVPQLVSRKIVSDVMKNYA